MTSSDPLDRLLSAADPGSGELDARVLASATALSDEARRTAAAERSPRRIRRWMPFAAAGVLAVSLTAAGAVASDLFGAWPVHLEIAGEVIDEVVDADVVIPVTYTTRAGETVSCTYAIAFVWGEVDELRAFVAGHDWSDFGQRAYERHVTSPHYPESVTQIDEDGTRRELTREEIIAEGPVFSSALGDVFEEGLPESLRDAEYVSSGQTDCEAGAE